MNRKFFISCFILTAVICAAYHYSYQLSIADMPDAAVTEESQTSVLQMEEAAAAANAGNPESIGQYYLKEEDGYISVYLKDQQTLYEYTSIRLESLPESLQKEIQTGKFLKGESELYDFLENYSS